MGEQPNWYPFIRAARYLKVAPWELMKQPVAWVHWANAAEQAEGKAEEELTNRAQRRGSKGKRARRR